MPHDRVVRRVAGAAVKFLALFVLLAAAAPGALWAQSAAAVRFDHFTTGFELEGAHLLVACESCHVAGVFQGTPTECGACHSSGGWVRATAKPFDHVRSAELCTDCHRTTTWIPLAQMNHDAIYGSCTTCHNNVQGVGKPPQHPQTLQECDACHRTTGWLPALFDHADVTGTCVSCHNGIGATGKHAGHVQTTSDCSVCHSTTAFIPAMFDHSNVTPGTCSSCHNGATSTGKAPGHFSTQLECDTCHNSDTWTPLAFTHSSANYPGDHAVPLTCTDCHASNAQALTWEFPAYAPDCAGCHASDYRPDPHRNAPVSQLRDCAGSCHQASPEHSVRSREW
jgi:hypothetical protein